MRASSGVGPRLDPGPELAIIAAVRRLTIRRLAIGAQLGFGSVLPVVACRQHTGVIAGHQRLILSTVPSVWLDPAAERIVTAAPR